MSTIKEVARLAEVSPSTVSIVLNKTKAVKDATRKRVLDAVRQLDYHPNSVARNLRKRKARAVGVVVPSISNPFFPSIIRGIEDYLASKNYALFLCNTDREREKELRAIEAFLNRQVDGAIFVSGALVVNAEYITKLRKNGIEVIAFDQRLDAPGLDLVLADHARGVYLATRHLISLNHRRIAFISAPLTRLARKQQMEGFMQAMEEKGLTVDDDLLHISQIEMETPEADYELDNGYTQAKSLLGMERSHWPTAMLAINDITAIGCLKALQEQGVNVPQDMSLVGYDDIPLARYVTPGLTTIAIPKYDMGVLAARLLLERIEGEYSGKSGRSLLLQPELVVRQSTCLARS